jgi:esterase/lipase superfamily enzyme
LAVVALGSVFGLLGCGGNNERPLGQAQEPVASSPQAPSGAGAAGTSSSAPGQAVASDSDAGSSKLDPSDGPMPVTTPDTDGSVVKMRVYYGTDRAAKEVPAMRSLSPAVWLRLTIFAAALTMFLAGLAHFSSGRRWLLAISAAGLALTVVSGVITARLRAQPADVDAPMKRIYGTQRGTLEVGVCEVNIPAQHEAVGPEKTAILHLVFKQDPLKNVVLVDTQHQTADEFYADMRSCTARSERKEALVFVHGFNVTFQDAARRTAQLAYDLQFDGVPIFFSWPSQGSLLDYLVDETNVAWSVPNFKEFLVNVVKQSGVQSVHVVAHSMGNRVVTTALKELHYEMGQDCPKFNEVVLTAPDVDAETFKQDLAPVIIKTAQRVTLYASSNDEALLVSKKVHGYARAGESGDQLVVVPGMDTIDVSAVDTSLLGHSYYGDNYTVLADLFDLLNRDRPPADRHWLRSTQLGQWVYWVFLRDAARLEAALSPAAPVQK